MEMDPRSAVTVCTAESLYVMYTVYIHDPRGQSKVTLSPDLHTLCLHKHQTQPHTHTHIKTRKEAIPHVISRGLLVALGHL